MKNSISIAMTTYNGEKFIKKQLISLLNQTKQADEVIIVDDCSQDNTVNIVTDFIIDNNLNNWNIVVLNENNGFIESFNKAISLTTGDIIFLCDQDDIWLENKIEIMYEIMTKNKNIQCLASKFEKIDSEDNKIKTRNCLLSTNNNLIRKFVRKDDVININIDTVITYNISPGCTYAFTKDIRNQFEYLIDKNINLVHDWKISLIASVTDGLYFLNSTTTLYRLHESNSLGLSRSFKTYDRIIACQKSYKEREYMEDIIQYLINNNFIKKIDLARHTISYINNLKKSFIFREEALKDKNLIKSLSAIYKYDLIKNRMYESIFVDAISICYDYI